MKSFCSLQGCHWNFCDINGIMRLLSSPSMQKSILSTRIIFKADQKCSNLSFFVAFIKQPCSLYPFMPCVDVAFVSLAKNTETDFRVECEGVGVNVTYFVGNGFDLSLGFRTSYSNFRQYYLRSTTRPTQTRPDFVHAVNRGKSYMRRDIFWQRDDWSNMEEALGKCSVLYNDSEQDYQDFMWFCDDIISALSAYLKKETQPNKRIMIPEQDMQLIVDRISRLLAKPFAHLPVNDVAAVRNVWDRHAQHGVHCEFITFNYTYVLDACLQAYQNHYILGAQKLDGGEAKITVTEPYHAHGTIDRGMIFGVGESGQIDNLEFRRSRAAHRIMKPSLFRANGTGVEQHVCHTLAKSKLLVVIGMSIGMTDKHWWLRVCEWLMTDHDAHVIIHYHDPELHPERGNAIYDGQVCLACRLRECIGYDYYTMVSNRIHLSVNAGIMDIHDGGCA